jgi:hypothetical protein
VPKRAGEITGQNNKIVGIRMRSARLCSLLCLVPLAANAALGPPPAGWPLDGNELDAALGTAVAHAGDVNGDGYSDLVLGAPGFDDGETGEGAAYVHLGSATGPVTTGIPLAQGNQPGAAFGIAVAGAGDVNGDGYADVLIGADAFDNGETDEGRAYLFLGSATGLATTPAWTAEGNVANARFGASVASAGDVNGDGHADLIVGAWNFEQAPGLKGGRAFVYLGSPTGPSLTPDWVVTGSDDLGRFGWTVNGAGDVNGDGYSDVIVGAPDFDSDLAGEGRAFVYLGGASGLAPTPAWTAEGDQLDADFGFAASTAGDLNADGYADVAIGAPKFDAPAVDAGRVFLFYGSAAGLGLVAGDTRSALEAGAGFGAAVAGTGDTDGDGCSDFVVGAPGYTEAVAGQGALYLYRGGCRAGQTPVFHGALPGPGTGARLGSAVSGAGDVNGDGRADLLAGAPGWDNGETDEGRAFAFLGIVADQPAAFPANLSWASEGDQAGGQWGASVAFAGDVDGDGFPELLIGAPGYDRGDPDEGLALLYAGGAAGLGPDAVPGTPTVWFTDGNQPGAAHGAAVAGAGDVNGDGYADVLVGAPGFDNGATDEGRAALYLGGPTGLATTPAWTAEGNNAGAHFGAAVASAGDVNGDGYADLIVGAWGFRQSALLAAGRVFVYLGSNAGPSLTPNWSVQGTEDDARFGWAVASAGDVNGDGYSDVIIGAPHADGGASNEGGAFVYLGSATGLALTPAWTAGGGQIDAAFGHAVAGAGDVNGDGYADVLVGAPRFNGAALDSGDARFYAGSAAGPSATPDWTLQGEALPANLEAGFAVSTAGDVNADGFMDLMVGTPGKLLPGTGAPNSGGVSVYLGSASGPAALSGGSVGSSGGRVGAAVAGGADLNGDGAADFAIGAPLDQFYQPTTAGIGFVIYRNAGTQARGEPLRPRKAGDTAPLPPLGGSGSPTGVSLQFTGRSPGGRGDVRLQVEIKPLGTPLDGTSLQTIGGWSDSGVGGVPLAATLDALNPNTAYHWRLRLLYRPSDNPLQPQGPWRTPASDGPQETDFRTVTSAAPDSDGDGIADTLDNCILVSNANQRDTNGDGYGNICDPDFNNNGIVDSQDGALLRNAFGSPAFPDRDLNGNGLVDSNDGARLRARFGQPPGPSGLHPP